MTDIVFNIPPVTPSGIAYLHSPTNEFIQFIRNILSISNLKNSSILELTSPTHIKMFQLAFIHKNANYRSGSNYEFLEFLGDKCLNDKLARYLHWRFPYIIHEGFMSKLHHKLTSEKYLAGIAVKYDFQRFMLFGNEDKLKFQNVISKGQDITKNDDFKSIMGDILEAFCGAIIEICNSVNVNGGGPLKPMGVADAIIYNLLANIMNKEEIDVSPDSVIPYTMMFNELCNEQNSMRQKAGLDMVWSSRSTGPRPNIEIRETINSITGNREYTINVYGYPIINGVTKRVLLSSYTGIEKDKSKEEACKIAMINLKDKYNITYTPKNPYA